ncbi:MAG: hypothetical protein PVG71_11600 [Anaerolineae bacterium]
MKPGFLPMALLFAAVLIVLVLSSGSSSAESARVTPLPPVENPDGRAGACYSFYPDPSTGTGRPFFPVARDAGSRWDRFDFIWPNLERQDGSWQDEGVEAYDTLVDDLDAAGFNMVGILLWTPDWAATSDPNDLSAPETRQRPPRWYSPVPRSDALSAMSFASAASSPPEGLYQPWDDWTTGDGNPINYWGRFVYKAVDRYGDQVKHWEMWNEPEWTYFWTGTSSDYAQLLKVGYQATEAACPECQVLFGGLHYWANPDYYKWVLNTVRSDPVAAANNYFFDIMSVHLYSRSSNTYEVVNDIRNGITARVSDHPIWLTETGVPVWNDAGVDPLPEKYDYAATQAEAASYVIQSYANASAADVSRYFFFRTHDADMTEYFGLVRNDQSLRPSYVALQVATSYLISPTMVTRQTEAQNVQRVTLWGTPRGKVSVLWNTRPDEVIFEYPAILPTATLVDRWGVTQTIQAAEGAYELTMPGATANLVSNPNDYIIGGEPYLVVEEDTVPPTKATVHPLPATTYSHTIQVSWEATDADAGVWGFDVQVSRDGGGWMDWLGLADTVGQESAPYTDGEHGETYCFRARAWDRAGNQGPWSDIERCTQFDLDRHMHLTVRTVFGDEDGDGDWDEDMGEPALDSLSFRLVDGSGLDVVPPGLGPSWEMTTTLRSGEYALLVEPESWPSPPPGWLPRRVNIDVLPGGITWELDHPSIGLLPHRSSSLLPLVARSQ